MSNFEYECTKNRQGRISVKLDGKIVGHIKPTGQGGYRYHPKSSSLSFSGHIYKSVEQVKADLEGEL